MYASLGTAASGATRSTMSPATLKEGRGAVGRRAASRDRATLEERRGEEEGRQHHVAGHTVGEEQEGRQHHVAGHTEGGDG